MKGEYTSHYCTGKLNSFHLEMKLPAYTSANKCVVIQFIPTKADTPSLLYGVVVISMETYKFVN